MTLNQKTGFFKCRYINCVKTQGKLMVVYSNFKRLSTVVAQATCMLLNITMNLLTRYMQQT